MFFLLVVHSLLRCDPSHKYGMTCLQANWRGVSAACYSNSQPHSRRGLGLRDWFAWLSFNVYPFPWPHRIVVWMNFVLAQNFAEEVSRQGRKTRRNSFTNLNAHVRPIAQLFQTCEIIRYARHSGFSWRLIFQRMCHNVPFASQSSYRTPSADLLGTSPRAEGPGNVGRSIFGGNMQQAWGPVLL